MSEKRASTIIERFGFKDADLTTPEHDTYLLWLLNKDNCLKMLCELNIVKQGSWTHLSRQHETKRCDWSWVGKQCSASCLSSDDKKRIETIQTVNENYRLNKANLKSMSPKISIDAEYPILGYNNFNIGFVDAKVMFSPEEYTVGVSNDECYFFQTFGDIIVAYTNPIHSDNNKILIEIKPKIKSLGELIRQINMYRSHIHALCWIILTETTSFDDVLKQQGILAYHPATV